MTTETLVLVVGIGIFILLVLGVVLSIREFREMGRHPEHFEGRNE